MNEKNRCVTGHRDMSKEQIAYVEHKFQLQMQAAIQDGYSRFISGFAEGRDLVVVSVVAEGKSSIQTCFWKLPFPMQVG